MGGSTFPQYCRKCQDMLTGGYCSLCSSWGKCQGHDHMPHVKTTWLKSKQGSEGRTSRHQASTGVIYLAIWHLIFQSKYGSLLYSLKLYKTQFMGYYIHATEITLTAMTLSIKITKINELMSNETLQTNKWSNWSNKSVVNIIVNICYLIYVYIYSVKLMKIAVFILFIFTFWLLDWQQCKSWIE